MKAAPSLTAALLLQSLSASIAFTASSQRQSPSTTLKRFSNVRQANTLKSSLPSPPSLSLSATSNPYQSPTLDTPALTKYSLAAFTELALFASSFAVLDRLSSILGITPPTPLVALLFYASSLKSRVFNPLDNSRPNRNQAISNQSSKGFKDRIMPKWTPPGVIFPIMWILIIGPLRAYSSALVVKASGQFLTLPTMAFMLHLTLGDVWNTINNTEKRYGAAVIGVMTVLASAINASIQYSSVLPNAGKLLGITCIWLSVATALITDTWRLNPVEIEGGVRRVPLYPVKGEAETKFLWFGQSRKEVTETENSSGPGCIQKVEEDVEEKVTYRNRAHLLKSKGIVE